MQWLGHRIWESHPLTQKWQAFVRRLHTGSPLWGLKCKMPVRMCMTPKSSFRCVWPCLLLVRASLTGHGSGPRKYQLVLMHIMFGLPDARGSDLCRCVCLLNSVVMQSSSQYDAAQYRCTPAEKPLGVKPTLPHALSRQKFGVCSWLSRTVPCRHSELGYDTSSRYLASAGTPVVV